MYISQLTIENIRCFGGAHSIEASKGINLIVGHNNSGKSTILKSIYHLQGYSFSSQDRTIDSPYSIITIKLETNKNYYFFNNFPNNPYTTENIEDVKVIFKILHSQGRDEIRRSINMFDKANPSNRLEVNFDPYVRLANRNLIYPYFSSRKVINYSKSILRTEREKVDGNLTNLFAKIDSLTSSNKNKSILYREACENILGLYIGTEQDEEGKYAAYSVDDDRSIPLTSMGDGVPHILGLITDLCIAEDKIFLIEEPENDIHPKALKALLKLVEEKSDTNQFFISTHSNVVVRYLGANHQTKIFQSIPNNNFSQPIKIPRSIIKEVSDDPKERLKVLEDLGYDVFDYALWKGWLFLEEASAETIINEILIPNFAKDLQNKIKTFSTRGFDGISEKFKNFSNLFIYSHLDSLYKNRAWVIIDAGESERKEIEKLKSYFPDWEANKQFRQLSKHNFEEYYPEYFSEKINEIINLDATSLNNEKKRTLKIEAKKQLLEDVRAWHKTDPTAAKSAFEKSAVEIIEILRQIEATLK
ncbi:ATP-dependent nuclease [Spirosoma gilvum]